MTEGFDSLVDRLMNMEGLDREEAEEMAVATLAAGGATRRAGEGPTVVPPAPAASVEQEEA